MDKHLQSAPNDRDAILSVARRLAFYLLGLIFHAQSYYRWRRMRRTRETHRCVKYELYASNNDNNNCANTFVPGSESVCVALFRVFKADCKPIISQITLYTPARIRRPRYGRNFNECAIACNELIIPLLAIENH